MSKFTLFLVVILVAAAIGVIIQIYTANVESLKSTPTQTESMIANLHGRDSKPDSGKDQPVPMLGDVLNPTVVKAKLELSGDRALSATVKYTEPICYRQWRCTLVGSDGIRNPYLGDAKTAIRVVVSNLGENPIVITAVKCDDNGLPLPVTSNTDDFLLEKNVPSKAELTIFSGESGYYFKRWRNFYSATTLSNDNVNFKCTVYFSGASSGVVSDNYLILERLPF